MHARIGLGGKVSWWLFLKGGCEGLPVSRSQVQPVHYDGRQPRGLEAISRIFRVVYDSQDNNTLNSGVDQRLYGIDKLNHTVSQLVIISLDSIFFFDGQPELLKGFLRTELIDLGFQVCDFLLLPPTNGGLRLAIIVALLVEGFFGECIDTAAIGGGLSSSAVTAVTIWRSVAFFEVARILTRTVHCRASMGQVRVRGR